MEGKAPYNERMAKLVRPFHPGLIDVKPLQAKGNNVLVSCNLQSRDHMDRMDEAFDMRWSNDNLIDVIEVREWVSVPKGKDPQGRAIYKKEKQIVSKYRCKMKLSFYMDGIWYHREDEGEGENPVNATSHAWKRAGTAVGIGRYLYRLPKVWVVAKDGETKYLSKETIEEAKRKLMLMDFYTRKGILIPGSHCRVLGNGDVKLGGKKIGSIGEDWAATDLADVHDDDRPKDEPEPEPEMEPDFEGQEAEQEAEKRYEQELEYNPDQDWDSFGTPFSGS